MSSNRILLLIVTVVYFWLCHVFINKICTDCDCARGTNVEHATTAAAATTADTKTTASANNTITKPIIFNWDSADGITSNRFAAYRDSLVAELKDGKNLEVYGYYFKDEKAPEGYANMGLARADELIDLLAPSIPRERMVPRARLISEVDGVRENPFESTRTRMVDAPKAADDKKEDEARVDEVGDLALIYFPFNSTQKEVDPKIDAYLNKLAKQLKETKQNVTLTGHTDNVGSEVSNFGLAERRAKVIRDILRRKGVSNSQITVVSKGEAEPTAPNDTNANRRLNRRVEVRIN